MAVDGNSITFPPDEYPEKTRSRLSLESGPIKWRRRFLVEARTTLFGFELSFDDKTHEIRPKTGISKSLTRNIQFKYGSNGYKNLVEI